MNMWRLANPARAAVTATRSTFTAAASFPSANANATISLHSRLQSRSFSSSPAISSVTAEQRAYESRHTNPSFSPTPAIPSSTNWDAVIVGAGHNGLTAANYLARSGLKVLVLERRHVVGGAAVTEELYPGFKYSRGSYLFSLFRPQIVEDLELKRHGLKFYFRDPSSFTPLHEGRHLMMGYSDERKTLESIAQFSRRDAALYHQYEEHLARLVSLFEPFLDSPPPSSSSSSFAEQIAQFRTLSAFARTALSLGREVLDFHEILTAPALRILERWFESEPLKSTLATDAVIGAMTSPSTPGSGYVLFHHVMGEVEGRKGAWAYVEGGMGGVSQALARSAREKGVDIVTNASVREISIENDEVQGVVLDDGQLIRCRTVLSNATPHTTFLRLMDRSKLPSSFRRGIEHLDTTSPVTKINLSLSRLPNFTCLPHNPATIGRSGPQHRGTIHLVENCEQIEAGYRDAVAGIASKRPVIEMTIPSSLDPTVAPEGAHVASMFVQYTPYNVPGGWSRGAREDFAKTCFGVVEEYAPGFMQSVLHYEVLTPPDLERTFGLTGGNIFHTGMGLDQLFWLRPLPGWSKHRTPINGLYMCGAGCHPGGGVMGSPGKNAAQVVAWDRQKNKSILSKKTRN